MPLIIIGLHGKPRSGKDTVCNRIIDHIHLVRYGPSVPVKKTAAAMFNVPERNFYDPLLKETIDPFWKISYREMAQKVGKESSRDVFGEDIWMRHVSLYLKQLTEDNAWDRPGGIVLADLRYANEAQWVKENNGTVVFIKRSDRPVADNESHPAEQGLDESLADIIIDNNGTLDDLYKNVDELINGIIIVDNYYS